MLCGSFDGTKFTPVDIPPKTYDEDFGFGEIEEKLKEAASGIFNWHEGRSKRTFGKGQQGDLKDRAAWTLYAMLRNLSHNSELLKSKSALQILSAVRYTANIWSQPNLPIGRSIRGEGSLKAALMDIGRKLDHIEEKVAHEVTQISGSRYIAQLKNQQESIYIRIRLAMLKGVTDHKVPDSIMSNELDSKDWGDLHGTYLQAVVFRVFRGPLTPAEEKALLATKPLLADMLKFIGILQQSTNDLNSDADPTLTFISNLANIQFRDGRAHYTYRGTRCSLPNGIAATFIEDDNSRNQTLQRFNALALHAVALKEAIALQEKIVELGRMYGDTAIYGGTWKALFALLPLVSNALVKIKFVINGLQTNAQAARHTKMYNSHILDPKKESYRPTCY